MEQTGTSRSCHSWTVSLDTILAPDVLEVPAMSFGGSVPSIWQHRD